MSKLEQYIKALDTIQKTFETKDSHWEKNPTATLTPKKRQRELSSSNEFERSKAKAKLSPSQQKEIWERKEYEKRRARLAKEEEDARQLALKLSQERMEFDPRPSIR